MACSRNAHGAPVGLGVVVIGTFIARPWHAARARIYALGLSLSPAARRPRSGGYGHGLRFQNTVEPDRSQSSVYTKCFAELNRVYT